MYKIQSESVYPHPQRHSLYYGSLKFESHYTGKNKEYVRDTTRRTI
jgi:hypothetical protein